MPYLIKKELYPKAKATLDRIKAKRTEFQGPYSSNLTQLMKRHLSAALTEDTPPFDMLEARARFVEILAILENEEHLAKQKKYNDCISIGQSHTVGLKTDGTVVAVGSNKNGECDTGGWRNIIAVAAGSYPYHTVGLKADGTVVAVGENSYGRCNTGGWRDIVAVFAEGGLIVGLKADGTVVAVGLNGFGQCNTGDWRDIVAVAVSQFNTVGLKADGTVVAVGDNNRGQCNTGGWHDIVAVFAEGGTFGLKADGTVVAVGVGVNKIGDWHDIGPVDKEQIKRRQAEDKEQELKENEQKRIKEERERQAEIRREEEAEKERRKEKKKRLFWLIFRSVLGGIIGVFFPLVLLSGEVAGALVFVGALIALCIVIGVYTHTWWIGLIGGIVEVLILLGISALAEAKIINDPFAYIILFILGALMINIVKKIRDIW